MGFLVFVAAVMLVGFILGPMVTGQGREVRVERRPKEQTRDIGVQTYEQVMTVEKEVAPDTVWICRSCGQSYHRGDCPCLRNGGVFRGSKMDRCRVCHR